MTGPMRRGGRGRNRMMIRTGGCNSDLAGFVNVAVAAIAVIVVMISTSSLQLCVVDGFQFPSVPLTSPRTSSLLSSSLSLRNSRDLHDNYDDDDNNDHTDHNNNNNNGQDQPFGSRVGIPQLPPMSYWRATGGSDENPVDSNSSNGNSTPSTSSAAATVDTSFVTPKFELQYTCGVCDTRNRVLVSRQAYREGMVIAICKGCNSKHWIADNLGGGGINIEDHLDLLRVSSDVFQLEKSYDLIPGMIQDENGNPVLE